MALALSTPSDERSIGAVLGDFLSHPPHALGKLPAFPPRAEVVSGTPTVTLPQRLTSMSVGSLFGLRPLSCCAARGVA